MRISTCVLAGTLLASTFSAGAQSAWKCLPGESWWGGAVEYAAKAPYGHDSFSFDLNGDVSNNQSAGLLISNRGRWIWSEQAFAYHFRNDSVVITHASGEVKSGTAGNSLASAYRHSSTAFFPSSGKWPDSLLLKAPQYNLWIELLDNPTQDKVMAYARKLLAQHYPPGVLMIDNRWEAYHGAFDFDRNTFPEPKRMMDSLHAMGFKVMLWTCPFITPDSKMYQVLLGNKYLLLDNEGKSQQAWEHLSKPYIIQWWDGFSACLDLTNPGAMQWLRQRYDLLQQEYQVDGFKFDAGDPYFYDHPGLTAYKNVLPTEHCRLWATVGLKYALNEYRAMWKMGGQPLVQRLSDKGHTWSDLQRLIPGTIAQQLLGYTFTCPDMIGGGQSGSFNEKTKVDQRLFVRSAQCHALMPMMQFSAAPWRVLDDADQQAVRKAVAIREEYLPYILKAVSDATRTGMPAVKPLEFDYPGQGYDTVKDQFLLGDELMVAPVVTPDNKRSVVFPKGKWRYKGRLIKGPSKQTFDVPLDEILVFRKEITN
jgi:alpha-glucosidase